jgi:cytochrome c
MFKKYFVGLSVAASLVLTGCTFDSGTPAENETLKKNVDGSLIYPTKANGNQGHYQAYAVNTQAEVGQVSYGRTPSSKEIAAWDLDVMPDGTGLPEGSGSVERGDELYEEQCAMCHGEMGTGGKGYPQLVGGIGTLKNQLIDPENGDEAPIRTIGSYWPYASTLFWYIQSAMPFPHPKSLSNDETYAITAYLLSLNEVTIDGEEMDDEYVLNKEKFLKIKLRNEDNFYPKVNGEVGTTEMNKFLNNSEGYGTKTTRCMTNCDENGEVVRIAYELNDFHPAPSTVRDLAPQKDEGEKSQVQKIYEETCAACHDNEVVGAPVLGDKDAWAEVLQKGIEDVYANAINGVNGMPAKGGNHDLSDKTMNEIVDYMISKSK